MSDVIGWQDVYVNGSLIGSYPMYQRGRYIEVDMHAAGVIPAGSMVTFGPLAATPPQPSAGLRDSVSDLLRRLDGWRQARIVGEAYEDPDEMVDAARRDLRAALAAKPDAGEGLDNVIERLAAKARKWRGQGWVSDAEWGAICAVLYVGEATDVTDADRKWAMGEIDRRATAEWPPTNEQVWAWYHSHPEWAEEDKRAKAEIDAGLRDTTDETGGGK